MGVRDIHMTQKRWTELCNLLAAAARDTKLTDEEASETFVAAFDSAREYEEAK